MAMLPAGAGLGAHWGVSSCSVRLGRDLEGLGRLPNDTPPVRGWLPTLTLGMALSQVPGGIPRGHLWAAGRLSHGHLVWASL